MRDAHQSLLATRMRTLRHRRASPAPMRAALPQLSVARMLGRRDLRRRHALPHRGPVGAAGAGARGARRTSCCRCCCAAPTASATPTIPTMSCSIFVAQAADGRHRPVPRLRLPELGREHARRDGRGGRGGQALRRRRSATPATSSIPTRAKYDLKYYVGAGQGARGGRRAYPRASRTWPGC